MEKNVSTRRIFLQKGLTLLAVAPTIPTFLDQTVMALSDPYDTKLTQRVTGKDGKILVVVQLSGGNDGMSMVIPYGDDVYYQALRQDFTSGQGYPQNQRLYRPSSKSDRAEEPV